MKTLVLFLGMAAVLFGVDPAAFEARKSRVRALLEQQDFRTALDQAAAINREWPDDIVPYQLMAAAHLGLGNYREAETAIQWMLDLRIGKADAQGWLLVARYREVTGDIEGALDAVNSASGQLVPGHNGLLAYAGRLHQQAGRLDLAEKALRQVLEGSPRDHAALETLAKVRQAQGKGAQTVQLLRDLAQASSRPRHLYLLAEATRDPRDFAAFERAARERIDSTDNANRELALYLVGPGKRRAEGLAIAQRESARRRDVFTLEALAVALHANGKVTEARSVMNSVLAVGTRDPEILAHAARIGIKSR